jgi:hypothetical protein
MSVPQWSLELTACPECGEVAEVTDRYTLLTTSGPAVFVRVACIMAHRFTVPDDTASASRKPDAPAA